MSERKDLLAKELKNYCKASNLAFNEEIKSMQRDGLEVYHLAFGQSPFPIPDCFVEALKENAGINAYLPVAGNKGLRASIAKFHLDHDGVSFNLEDIIVSPGSKELIYLTMRLFSGEILLISPSWTTYAPQTKLAGHEPVIVDTSFDSEWKVTPELLEATLKANGLEGCRTNKLMVLNNPGNPSGTSYTEKELESVTEVCRRHNIFVLSDEIYARLNFAKNHVCMAKVYPEGTILTSGFSKWASAGGWRMGYAVVPENLGSIKKALISAASHTYSCAPAPMQAAVEEGLRHSAELESYLDMERRILKAVGDYCVSHLRSVGVKVHPSSGGYYIFPDFEVVRKGLNRRGLNKCQDWCNMMLSEAKVALMHGHAFLRPEEELTTRLCFVDFDGSAAMEAVVERGEEIGGEGFVKKYAPKVAKAMDNLKMLIKSL